MSDFHDALHRAAQPHGEAVGKDLTADAVVASSVRSVSEGRRRRAAMQAVASVAAVGAVVAGAWLVLPLGAGDQEPAGADPVHAGPFRYEVGDDPDAVPVEEPALLLRGEDAVMCGDELSLEPGVSVHSDEAFGRGLSLAAELKTLGDIMEGTPPATPQPLFSDMPDGPTDGWDPASPQWEVVASGALRTHTVSTLLLDGSTVVGLQESLSGSGQEEGIAHYGGGSGIPAEGQCGDVETREDLVELWDRGPGDPFTSVLVAQFWGGDAAGSTLLATIVIDPNEPANTDQEPTAVFDQPAPAELEAPDGAMHQSFIVPRPIAGCAPLAELREGGTPTVDMEGPPVEVPGAMGDLSGELWGAEPVLTVPAGDEPWFVERDAWLVADIVSAGIEDPHLDWTSLSSAQAWALALGGEDPLRDPECVYALPIPEVFGAVFLVVDGVAPEVEANWGDATVLPEEMQTWIYLGQAE
ncbi:hypothetical protein [Demequina activiva]|uniref:Uncharacterized protein n=1 Tax=Demequina activiva TaxID=1582364 RepID=A0A919UJI5_9MICO|nr:hypothetical protein [Demequina activiva]GIG53815.1 hypothetical protein Dac01nite_05670 [Demequina activiva]